MEGPPDPSGAPRPKRARPDISYAESSSEDKRVEDDEEYQAASDEEDVTPPPKAKGKKKGIFCKYEMHLTRKVRCLDDLGWNQLAYCGRLAVGEPGSGTKPPVICDISWNNCKILDTNFSGSEIILACSGTFGTCFFTYPKSPEVDSGSGDSVKDLEQGWSKRQLSDIPAKLCKWSPLKYGRWLAVGAVGDDGRGRIFLVNCIDAIGGNYTFDEIFTFNSGRGLNSLSWDSKGQHLLVTCNEAKTILVLKHQQNAAHAPHKLIDCPYLKLREYPDTADIFGVFHPDQKRFFIASNHGLLVPLRCMNSMENPKKTGWVRNGYTNIAIRQDMQEVLQAGIVEGPAQEQVQNEDFGIYADSVEVLFPEDDEHANGKQPDLSEDVVNNENFPMNGEYPDYDPDFGIYADAVEVLFPEDDEHANGKQVHKSTNLTATQRLGVYAALLERSNNGKLKKTTTREVAEMYNVSMDTVRRIWQRVKQCRQKGIPVDVSSRKTKNCGRKKIEIDLKQVKDVPLERRGTIRSLGGEIGATKSSVHRWLKLGLLRRHSNALKPLLKEANKIKRLRWCISMLDQSTLPNNPHFIDMFNIIHVDEKWFNSTKINRNLYLHPDEEDPYRTVQNKNAIDKVMFLAAVARPRFDSEGNCTFDGKLGVWPFTRQEPAQRRSRNRERGTLVTKTINVIRDTMRTFMIAKLLPAIVSKWPQEDAGKTIWIQQDNAPSHVPSDDEQFNVAVAQTGLDIRLISQPPNSPDMNALDLGFFASLQSLVATKPARNMDDIIRNVEDQFQKYEPYILNRVFLTLQGCFLLVMRDRGGNKYKVPHMNKSRLEALGILPRRLSCPQELYEQVMASLQE